MDSHHQPLFGWRQSQHIAVVEAAFGTFAPFDRIVRAIFIENIDSRV